MNTNEHGSTAAHSSLDANFSLKDLDELMDQLKPSPALHFTLNQSAYDELRNEMREAKENAFGMPIYLKPGQAAQAWLIYDSDVLNKYLRDEIKESDLEEMWKTEGENHE